LASKIYNLSRDEIQNFPFSVMSINITRIALQILRTGKINKECNHQMKHQQKSKQYRNDDLVVYEVFQELYEAIFYKIFTIWKNEGKTMTESGFVIRDVETFAKNKPMELVKAYRKNQTDGKERTTSKSSSSSKSGGDSDKIESFVGIEDLQ